MELTSTYSIFLRIKDFRIEGGSNAYPISFLLSDLQKKKK